jgi:MerR HTH family regulatory protein
MHTVHKYAVRTRHHKENPVMVKVSNAPKNFYSASEAAKRLGMPKTTFFQYVRTGKIKKVVPPGQVEGYYPKSDIDKLARERELFILEYASEPSTFIRASEEDIRGIHELCVSLFGLSGSPNYETMLSWQKKNPSTYYVLKQEGIVTGYIGFLYLNEKTTRAIMSDSEPSEEEALPFTPGNAPTPSTPEPPDTEVQSFTPGKPISGLFLGIGVRPGLSATQARQHGRHLISGGVEVLENFARQGMQVKKLYATSRTTDGIRLSRKLGFKEIVFPSNPLIRFELDVEQSDSPLLTEYKKIAKKYNPQKRNAIIGQSV